jgi:hypothetical protein
MRYVQSERGRRRAGKLVVVVPCVITGLDTAVGMEKPATRVRITTT